jgi:hypothetical protein
MMLNFILVMVGLEVVLILRTGFGMMKSVEEVA